MNKYGKGAMIQLFDQFNCRLCSFFTNSEGILCQSCFQQLQIDDEVLIVGNNLKIIKSNTLTTTIRCALVKRKDEYYWWEICTPNPELAYRELIGTTSENFGLRNLEFENPISGNLEFRNQIIDGHHRLIAAMQALVTTLNNWIKLGNVMEAYILISEMDSSILRSYCREHLKRVSRTDPLFIREEEQAFIRAMQDAKIGDQLPAKIYADWLDERGRYLEATYWRNEQSLGKD
jgi:uncharacterized protein (TIGR02996 family)